MTRVHAVLRGTSGAIRVWNGSHGRAEEFTIDEAKALCASGDLALTEDRRERLALMAFDDSDGTALLTVSRAFLVDFLAAVRGALRTVATLERMAARPACIDDASDPGSWARHLRHVAPMRAGAEARS